VCPICMSSPVFAIQLKCDHIFCYLCVKGVMNGSNKCPLCRRTIDANVLNRPKFVRNGTNGDRPSDAFNSVQWFYEGRKGSGFWAYDHKNTQILEQAFAGDQKMCEIMISGVIYCVDFVRLVQYRKYEPSRKRAVKRDLLSNIDKAKGIAGVSKYLVRDLFAANHSTSDPNNASNAEPNPSNDGNQSVDNISADFAADGDESEEPMAKKIKVEVKEEPDSTSDH